MTRERPFFNLRSADLIALAYRDSENVTTLAEVTYELQFRRMVPRHTKAAVVGMFVDFVLSDTEEDGPGFEFPEIDLSITRQTNRLADGERDWREVGLLRLSGYAVGKTKGIDEDDRRRILNFLFLKDDLSDVDDALYAAEWGEPMSPRRLEHIAESVAVFASQALRKTNDYSQAIDEWAADLEYLKAVFYDDWGGFPWPNITA